MLYIRTAEGWKPWLASYKVCDNHNKLEGVFTDTSLEDNRKSLQPRIDRFCALMREGQAKNWNEPLFGAYGEKL